MRLGPSEEECGQCFQARPCPSCPKPFWPSSRRARSAGPGVPRVFASPAQVFESILVLLPPSHAFPAPQQAMSSPNKRVWASILSCGPWAGPCRVWRRNSRRAGCWSYGGGLGAAADVKPCLQLPPVAHGCCSGAICLPRGFSCTYFAFSATACWFCG